MKYLFQLLFFITTLSADYTYDFDGAGREYGINPALLYAIAKAESGLNPNAVGNNTNGTQDIGLMQINTVHLNELAQQGISKNDLFDPTINTRVGAKVLKQCVDKHGASYEALNCYNGKIRNNDYYLKVLKQYYNPAVHAQAVSSKKIESSSKQNLSLKTSKQRIKILLLGDQSVAQINQKYKKILKRYSVNFIAKYKDDSTSDYWAEQNLISLVEQIHPDLVLVSLGTHDAKSPNIEAINYIVEEIKKSGKKMVWIAPNHLYSEEYKKILTTILDAKNIIDVYDKRDLISYFVTDNKKLNDD
jgi:hypothetical protein